MPAARMIGVVVMQMPSRLIPAIRAVDCASPITPASL
jgi:hypothetical protein